MSAPWEKWKQDFSSCGSAWVKVQLKNCLINA